jgi:hypothetical protein
MEAGKKENITPVRIKGNESESGIIPCSKSIKKRIIPKEKRMILLKKGIEN